MSVILSNDLHFTYSSFSSLDETSCSFLNFLIKDVARRAKFGTKFCNALLNS